MQRIVSFFVILLFTTAIHAQTKFLDRLRADETGKGKVTIEQSQSIDVLVNGTPNQKKTLAEKEQAQHENNKQPTAQDNKQNRIDDDTETEPVIDTRKKIMRNSYKTQGYRVQAFSGGNSRADKKKAEDAGMAIKRMMPDEPVYVHFYSPSWKCRVGNYQTLEEAHEALRQIKQIYPQACIVKGTISVQY